MTRLYRLPRGAVVVVVVASRPSLAYRAGQVAGVLIICTIFAAASLLLTGCTTKTECEQAGGTWHEAWHPQPNNKLPRFPGYYEGTCTR